MDPGPDLYAAIDETVASQGDYIRWLIETGTGDCCVSLSDVDDPVSSAGHIVSYEFTTTELINFFRVDLLQGMTVIAQWEHGASIGWTQVSQTLTTGEADSITDYTDLRLRFVLEVEDAPYAVGVTVSWAELEVPCAPELSSSSSGSSLGFSSSSSSLGVSSSSSSSEQSSSSSPSSSSSALVATWVRMLTLRNAGLTAPRLALPRLTPARIAASALAIPRLADPELAYFN